MIIEDYWAYCAEIDNRRARWRAASAVVGRVALAVVVLVVCWL